MKAVWYKNFGKPEDVLVFGEYKEPAPKNNEVKIRLRVSAVNPSDTKKRIGANPKLLDEGPVIPNSDGAGEIVGVGKNVSEKRIGERVWIYNGQFGRQEGTCAEFICVPEKQAVKLPKNITFEAGAMMGIPAMTAHRCVTSDGPVSGKTVLVTGGAGRVGYYAIQWAKFFGASVIATSSNIESTLNCKKAGADLVVEHPSPKTTQKILHYTNGRPIDRVVDGDFGINLEHILDLIKINGVITTYSSMSDLNPKIPFMRMMFMDLTIRMVLVYIMPWKAKKKAIKDITQLLKADKLENRIANTYSIENSAQAHQEVEQGNNFGSVIIKI